MSAPAFEKKPGGESLVQAQEGAQGVGVGKRTLTEQLPPVATYTVKPGESLTAIAAKLKTTVEALKAANGAKLKTFPSKHGPIECFNAGEVIAVPGARATAEMAGPTADAATPDAATPDATPPAPAQPGMFDNLLDRVTGAMHGAWDRLIGGGGKASAHDGKVAEGGASDPHGKAGGKGADGTADVAADGSADGAADGTATGDDQAPFAELTGAERGAKLSTMQPDELGTLDKFGMSATGRATAKKRGQWLTAAQIHAAGRNKSGDAYTEAVDGLLDATKLTEDQGKIIAAAREFAAAPKPLSAEQEAHATLDWSTAQTTLDGVTLNPDLKARLERYVRFLAWANLVTGATPVGSVMRSPATAHKLSVAWMFNLTTNKSDSTSLTKSAANRQKLVANVTASGGSDKDGNQWLSDATVEGLKAKKDDDDALLEYIQTTAAPEANKVQTQAAVAAEGYKTPDKRHPNIAPGTFISNHLTGEAVDMQPPFVFSNRFDPIIDAIAVHFGLWRAVKDDTSSPEHWHYERLGSPKGSEEGH